MPNEMRAVVRKRCLRERSSLTPSVYRKSTLTAAAISATLGVQYS